MKNILKLFVLTLVLISCSQESENIENTIEKEANKIAEKQINQDKKITNGVTELCKVDGEDWGYSKGSGIVTTDRKTGERNAIFTFSKKIQKKKETIQLEYDLETNKLTRVIVDMKRPTNQGKVRGKMYTRLKDHKKEYTGNVFTSGTVDVGNAAGGSGTAEFFASDPFHDNEGVFDEKYRFVEVTDLKFDGVGFSDLSKVKKKLDALSGE